MMLSWLLFAVSSPFLSFAACSWRLLLLIQAEQIAVAVITTEAPGNTTSTMGIPHISILMAFVPMKAVKL